MTREELEACWKDPQNRKWGVYYCKADPRVIVPKRLKGLGWTIKFAPSQRHSRRVAYARHRGGSHSLCEGLGRRIGSCVSYPFDQHCSGVSYMRLFVVK